MASPAASHRTAFIVVEVPVFLYLHALGEAEGRTQGSALLQLLSAPQFGEEDAVDSHRASGTAEAHRAGDDHGPLDMLLSCEPWAAAEKRPVVGHPPAEVHHDPWAAVVPPE